MASIIENIVNARIIKSNQAANKDLNSIANLSRERFNTLVSFAIQAASILSSLKERDFDAYFKNKVQKNFPTTPPPLNFTTIFVTIQTMKNYADAKEFFMITLRQMYAAIEYTLNLYNNDSLVGNYQLVQLKTQLGTAVAAGTVQPVAELKPPTASELKARQDAQSASLFGPPVMLP